MQNYWKTTIFTLWLLVFIGNVFLLPLDEVVEAVEAVEAVDEVKELIDDPIPDEPVDDLVVELIDEPLDRETTEVIEELKPRGSLFHSISGIIQSVGKSLGRGGGVF